MSKKTKTYLTAGFAVWATALLCLFVFIRFSHHDHKPAPTRALSPAQLQDQALQKSRQTFEANQQRLTKTHLTHVKHATVGARAPLFSLPGRRARVALRSLRGHPVMMEFFASWCPHCRAMAPILDQAATANPRLRFVMVSAAKEPMKTVDHWYDTFLGQPMTAILAYDSDQQVSRNYGLAGYPTLAFIDASGTLKELTAGERTPAQIDQSLARIGVR
jgi:thiol-disulfide isomerase/thioredoxin